MQKKVGEGVQSAGEGGSGTVGGWGVWSGGGQGGCERRIVVILKMQKKVWEGSGQGGGGGVRVDVDKEL